MITYIAFAFVVVAMVIADPAPEESYGAQGNAGYPYYPGIYYNGAFPYHYSGFPYNYGGYPYNYGGFPYNYGGFPYGGYQQPGPVAVPPTHPAAGPVYPPNYALSVYQGEFGGTCKGKSDGLYFVDERSFAFCSGGVKSIQACAEGSINPGVTSFTGGQQHYYDFCSINISAQNQAYRK